MLSIDDMASSLDSDSDESLDGVFIQPGSPFAGNGHTLPGLARKAAELRSRPPMTAEERESILRGAGAAVLRGGALARERPIHNMRTIKPEILEEVAYVNRTINEHLSFVETLATWPFQPAKLMQFMKKELKILARMNDGLVEFLSTRYGGRPL